MSRAVLVRAPAKVNLGLRVGPPRPDGFHDLDTVFQAIGLYDDLVVEVSGTGPAEGEARAGGGSLPGAPGAVAGVQGGRVTLDVLGADVGPVERNLAYLAAAAYLERLGGAGGVRGAGGAVAGVGVAIRLEKRIPAGAGLGGGSSDAAAVLRALEGLLGGVGPEALGEIAASLGSDVPFFLGPAGRARGRGRGEVLTPLAPLPERWLVVGLPPVHVSTAEAYRALDEARAGGGAVAVPSALGGGGAAGVTTAEVHNDFEEVVAARHPEVARTLAALRAQGASGAMLSGSGGAAFGFFGGEDEAVGAAAALAERVGWPFVAAPTLATPPAPEPVPGGHTRPT